MNSLNDKVVAITGAASGIGRATAIECAKRGAEVAISDMNEPGLAETAEKCRALGAKVSTQKLDVAQREAVFAWAEKVVRDHGRVNVIINNAGVALSATIEGMDYSDFDWLMNINFWGVVHGTKAFLPHIKRSGDGHVVNVSSVFGLFAVPTQSAYNAAKFAVRGFTECLRAELIVEGAPVGVTCIHPGGIKTNIAKASRMKAGPAWGPTSQDQAAREFEKMAATTPERAAQIILGALLKNKMRQMVGMDAVIMDFLVRLSPRLFQWLVIAGSRARRKKLAASAG